MEKELCNTSLKTPPSSQAPVVLFVAFPDDNSYLAPNCSKWGNDGRDIECNKWGYYQNKGFFRIYNDPIIWEGKHYINLKPSVLACDDSTDNPYPLSQGDKWQLFVR